MDAYEADHLVMVRGEAVLFFLFSTEDISAHILNEYNPSAQLPSVVMVSFDSSDIFCFRERLISQKRVADWLKAIMLGAVEPSSK